MYVMKQPFYIESLNTKVSVVAELATAQDY